MGLIDTANVQQFSANVTHLSQQKGSKLRSTVMVETGVVGEYKWFEQLGKGEAKKKTTRHADTPDEDENFQRRRATLFDYEFSRLIADSDRLKTIIDPESAMVRNGAWAMGRAMDDEVITNALGTAYTGKDGSTQVTFPASQQVAAGSDGLTLAKLLAGKELFGDNDVDEDEDMFCIVTSKQVTNLLNTTEVKSADYNTVKALAAGQVDTFLGFKFIRTQRLTQDGSSNRQVLLYARSGIGLAIAQDIKTRVQERPDKSYDTNVYLSLGIGAARVEEEKVVEIKCVES